MKSKELLQVYAYAKLLWPTFKLPDDGLEAILHDQLWLDMLNPFDLGLVITAMKECAKESDFCTIGKIAAQCESLQQVGTRPELNEDSIYNEIYEQVTSPTYAKPFNELTPIAQKVIGNNLRGWRQSEFTDFVTIISPSIRKAIRRELERTQKYKNYEQSLELQKQLETGSGFTKLIGDKKDNGKN